MVFFNYSTMQMAAKIVYYGPGLCGKTTNLQHIYGRTSSGSRGEMVSLETDTDRTLFFDLLPIDVGTIQGFNTRIQLYTVPGQVFYNTTRKLVLKGVDGVVFVADSQRAMRDTNVESFSNLEQNLAEIGLSVDSIPLVLQYNKRDLQDILTVDELNDSLNRGNWPHFEASALQGHGVFETLKGISKLTLVSLKTRILEMQGASSNTNQDDEPSGAPQQPSPKPPPVATQAETVAPGTGPSEAAPTPDPEPSREQSSPPTAQEASTNGNSQANGSEPKPRVDILAELEKIRQQAARNQGESAAESPNPDLGLPSGEPAEKPHANGSPDQAIPESAPREHSEPDHAAAAMTNNGHAGTQVSELHFGAPRLALEKARNVSISLRLEDAEAQVVDTVMQTIAIRDVGQLEQLLSRINSALDSET